MKEIPAGMTRTAWLLSRGYAISGGAISVHKEWVSGESLTAADLTGSFTHIVQAGIALVSPATGEMDWDSKDQTNCDEIHFVDAAAVPSASGRLRRNSATLTWRGPTNATVGAYTPDADGTAALSLQNDARNWLIRCAGSSSDAFIIRDATGGTNWLTVSTAGVFTIAATGTITPAAVSGTPAAHSIYRENVTKGWVKVSWSSGTPSIDDSFNVSSITDEATGDVSVVWDRDFANANYAAVATARHSTPNIVATATAKAVGSARFVTTAGANAVALDVDGDLSVIAIGDQ